MKALSKLKPEPGIWMTDVPMPKMGNTDVLIQIKKTAICGTDLHIYKWDAWAQKTIKVPMHIGHEYVGVIVDKGKDVKDFEIGDRVSGEGHITCGCCRHCRGGKTHLCAKTLGTGVNIPGAFAEFLSAPAFNAFKVPKSIPDSIVSIFDPFGNAVHTALSSDLVGEDILITGAGPVGLMAVAICRHVGAKNIVITDINPYRLDLAKKLGATKTVNVSQCQNAEDMALLLRGVMKELDMKEGFDVGLEMSGFETAINALIEVMKTGGSLVLLGVCGSSSVQIDWNKIVWRGLFLKGIYGREMFETWYKMVALIETGLDISPVITHEFPVDDFQKGFDILMSGQCGKVILNWS